MGIDYLMQMNKKTVFHLYVPMRTAFLTFTFRNFKLSKAEMLHSVQYDSKVILCEAKNLIQCIGFQTVSSSPLSACGDAQAGSMGPVSHSTEAGRLGGGERNNL